ncbi:L,D-transpeptidase family protein [Methylopila sp. M107]|uniref:L,D-transpeptidase family protein n=1 Tax=Methylopila sp. M107 TaxID=1101190 RepID=UPI00037CC2CF|nr:L,D-transpeptidase family protein [Methylopila sp. M107]
MTDRSAELLAATRREALKLGLGAAAAGVTAAQAAAQSFGAGEWKDRFDASSGAVATRTSSSRVPTLSRETASATEQAIASYQDIVGRGGWNTVPNGPRLKLGSTGERVVALRKRLMASGDLDPNVGMSPTFDSYVEGGVRRFQARHGLIPVGVVGDDTLSSLNIAAPTRLRQLEINLVRIRTMANGDMPSRYVMANVPAAEVETVEDGQVSARYTAVVGKVDRASPTPLDAKILQVNLNPFWTVPASIVKKDLIPQMQKDPKYLTKKNIQIIDKSGAVIPPEQINWQTDEATNYMYKQDPGEDNSMGTVRINMQNPDGVYMHDTPSKNLFGENARFHSSGCMRIQNVKELCTWLLKNQPNWNRRSLDAAIKTGNRIDIQVSPPIPVLWRYISGWGAADGTVQFREDIYGKDGTGELAMAGGGTSAATGQAGQ